MPGFTTFSIYYAPSVACKAIIEDHLNAMGLEFDLETVGSVTIRDLSSVQHEELNAKLSRYGIKLTGGPLSDLIEQIKLAIIEVVWQEEGRPNVNISDHLSKKLNYSYGYLTAIFSEATYTSISHFMILQKVERIKDMLLNQNLTLTEISYQLGYSSVAYLSNQFKMVTGLTPTKFKDIIKKKIRKG